MRFIVAVLFLAVLPLNILSQGQFVLDDNRLVIQNYEGMVLLPLPIRQISVIKQVNDQTIYVKQAGNKEKTIKVSKGEIVKIHKKRMETSGMASTMQEIETLTLKLPVKEDTFSLLIQDMKEPVVRKVYRTKGSESFELRYFDKQGELHKYELSHASKKRKMTDTIDCSKPMTLHVIKYDGSECEVVETDVETYHMWNTIRILPRGVGNQLNDSEISRIVSAFKYNHETFGLFIYYIDKGEKCSEFFELKPTDAWLFAK